MLGTERRDGNRINWDDMGDHGNEPPLTALRNSNPCHREDQGGWLLAGNALTKPFKISLGIPGLPRAY